ncbi:NPCBM/NEW2 domain-containing protein [Streptomyces chiangmaiensis]|uniref:NPCBM/NEW2 domain-containing protein n=1 Tax=Streptomyces chiangmaiensis TaxID=766497 RepID=A0ABU7FF29_9ACTN|nr:NPCBM/NEW2 domain-containing protein [Streptomyces chiangmaiensis]MED7822428.1 NPCBM/NEW2 domain-containing protein [Streptomyces chiangmaiensis]
MASMLIHLVVTDGGDGDDSDHADWADAKLGR